MLKQKCYFCPKQVTPKPEQVREGNITTSHMGTKSGVYFG